LRISTREDPLRSYTAWLPSDVTSAPGPAGKHASGSTPPRRSPRTTGRPPWARDRAAASLLLPSRSSTIHRRSCSSSPASVCPEPSEAPLFAQRDSLAWRGYRRPRRIGVSCPGGRIGPLSRTVHRPVGLPLSRVVPKAPKLAAATTSDDERRSREAASATPLIRGHKASAEVGPGVRLRQPRAR
jgi:hypothetical protein